MWWAAGSGGMFPTVNSLSNVYVPHRRSTGVSWIIYSNCTISMCKNLFRGGNESCDKLDFITDPLKIYLESESAFNLQCSHLYLSFYILSVFCSVSKQREELWTIVSNDVGITAITGKNDPDPDSRSVYFIWCLCVKLWVPQRRLEHFLHTMFTWLNYEV